MLNKTQLPPYQTFFTKLCISNPLEKNYSDFQSIKDGDLISEEALSKLKMKQPPATGQKNYQYLTSVWQQENMCTFKNFLRWYNSKDVVPTLEVMKKMVDFYHEKGIDMLKLGYTLPNLAINCFHKSTTAIFYRLTESDNDLLQKIVNTWLVDHTWFVQAKLLWTRLLLGIQQTCAKVLSELMLVSFIFSLCVKPCQLVCTRDAN